MNKTKTIILLIRIIDGALDKLINSNLTEEQQKRQLYKYHFAYGLLDELFKGIYNGIYNKNYKIIYKVEYNWLEVIKPLTPFQETLFTAYEIEKLGYSTKKKNKYPVS